MHFLMIHLLLASWPASWTPLTSVLSPSQPLDVGYLEMYNLQFDEAHRTFADWEKSHPLDPLAFTSDGAAYLFSEFDRLGVLQSDLFVDDGKFKRRKRPKGDPAVEAAFNRDLDESDRLADAILEKDPQDRDALFAKVLNEGLRGDYAALIEKKDLASLGNMKNAGELAERLLAVDPHCYDAYLAVGVENYMLGLSAAPVRWLLRLYGAETDKQAGIEKLELTAEKGHYLLPFARLLLAVAAMRDHNKPEARNLLQNLAEAFPNNDLYRKELARIE
ncbi:MAG TPA: hypothetical protein VGZ29_07085 [Terriglobia bacterium]|nr:hypothetical protein [Terriglobia bacterium]